MTRGSPRTEFPTPVVASRATVLVAREAGSQTLEMDLGADVQVVQVEGSDQAVAVLERYPVDVVVACQDLAPQSGIELLEEARRRQAECQGVLLCDRLGLELARRAADQARVFRVLVAPCAGDRLVAAVAAALDQSLLDRRRGGDSCAPLRRGGRGDGGTRGILESMLPDLPAATLCLDADGRVCCVNDSAQLILGRDREQLIGRPAPEAGVPCRERPDTLGVAPSLCCNRDVSRVRSWDRERVLVWSCRALEDDAGEHMGCDVSFVDVTDRDELDVRVFMAKHEIESVFDSITDPTLVVGAERVIKRANRALSFFVDKPFNEILGRPLETVLEALSGGQVGGVLDEVFATGREADTELSTAGERVYKVRGFPLVRAGRVDAVVVRYHDVTSERQMEARLLHAEKLASIGRLSAGIAHEINNPVGFISWNINQLAEYVDEFRGLYDGLVAQEKRVLAGETSADEALRSCLEAWESSDLLFALEDAGAVVAECNQGVERVRKIVRDLRSYSHPNPTDWEVVDLRECLEAAVSMFGSELRSCRLAREFRGVPAVRCRPQAVTQVFVNLLSNAVQAMTDPGLLTLRLGPVAGGAAAEVEDTGCGIDPAVVDKIFDPFFTTKGVGEGTGLGLHLAHAIVQEHMGEITVESTPGEGALFRVFLPADPGGGAEDPASQASGGGTR